MIRNIILFTALIIVSTVVRSQEIPAPFVENFDTNPFGQTVSSDKVKISEGFTLLSQGGEFDITATQEDSNKRVIITYTETGPSVSTNFVYSGDSIEGDDNGNSRISLGLYMSPTTATENISLDDFYDFQYSVRISPDNAGGGNY